MPSSSNSEKSYDPSRVLALRLLLQGSAQVPSAPSLLLLPLKLSRIIKTMLWS